MKNKTLRVLSMLLVLVMVLGLCACGAGNPATPAESSAAESSAEAPAEVKLKIGIITTSGIDDGSFNQNNYEGILAFIAENPDSKVTPVREETGGQYDHPEPHALYLHAVSSERAPG